MKTLFKKSALLIYALLIFTSGAYQYRALIAAAVSNAHLPWVPVAGLTPDFLIAYCSGLLANSSLHHRTAIYDFQAQLSVMQQVLAPQAYPSSKPFFIYHSPFFFLLTMPLSAFNVGQAWVLWWATGLILIAAAFCVLLKRSDLTRNEKCFAIVGFFFSAPLIHACFVGQPSLFVVPVFLLIFLLLDAQKYTLSGLSAALFLIKVQYLPTVLIGGLVMGRSRFLRGFSIGFLCIAAICLIVLGWQNVIDFPRALALEPSKSIVGVEVFTMQNLRGQLFTLTGADTALVKGASALIYLAAQATIGLLWWQAREDGTGSAFRLCAAVTTLIMLSTSFHTTQTDYMMAIIPCVWLWSLCRDEDPSKQKTMMKALIILYPLLSFNGFAKTSLYLTKGASVQQALPFLFPFLNAVGLWDASSSIVREVVKLKYPVAWLGMVQVDFLWALAVGCLAWVVFSVKPHPIRQKQPD